MIDLKDAKRAYKKRVKERLLAEPDSEWAIEYRAKRKAEKKNWDALNPDVKRMHGKKYYMSHREKLSAKNVLRKKNIREASGIPLKIPKTKEDRLKYIKQWHSDNRERINTYRKERRQSDPAFRLACNLRTRLSFLIRKASTSKTSQTLDLLGCHLDDFMKHLEAMFHDGMNWGNYGSWHIDHKIPCASFDLTRPDHQRQCFHFSNLQPLWAEDNRKKSDSLDINKAGSREGDGVYRKTRKTADIRSRIRFTV